MSSRIHCRSCDSRIRKLFLLELLQILDKKRIKTGRTACWIGPHLAQPTLHHSRSSRGGMKCKDSNNFASSARRRIRKKASFHFLCLDLPQVHPFGKPNHIQNTSCEPEKKIIFPIFPHYIYFFICFVAFYSLFRFYWRGDTLKEKTDAG